MSLITPNSDARYLRLVGRCEEEKAAQQRTAAVL